MNVSKNTILITGAGSGIGLALARQFSALDNQVIICGRQEGPLKLACDADRNMAYKVCDIADFKQRKELFDWVTIHFPDLNILVNNAGIQIENDFTSDLSNDESINRQIDINLKGTIAMCALFAPYFKSKSMQSAICNVTSGLAFIPIKSVPVYCATKAGLHAFTMCLRSQLRTTNVKVFEFLPPIVDTNLHQEPSAKKQGKTGVSPDSVAIKIVKAIKNDKEEYAIGRALDLKIASRIAPHFFHGLLNKLVSK